VSQARSAAEAGVAVLECGSNTVDASDFGPSAPAALDASRFKLAGRMTNDLFACPEVEGDTNIHGALGSPIEAAPPA
jgi:gamma-glutamyltranspeptidase/glutathione hydrolase